MIYYIKLDKERQRLREGRNHKVWEKLEKEVSLMLALIMAAMAAANYRFALGKKKEVLYHLLLTEGYLKDVLELLDEQTEEILRMHISQSQMKKFKKYRGTAFEMQKAVGKLLNEMGMV